MRFGPPIVPTVLLLTVGVAFGGRGSGTEPPATPDHRLGLEKSSVFEVPAPPAVIENQSAPGERSRLPRPQPEGPPVIPHGVADWLPITVASNPCVDCHAVEEKLAGEPTPMPASHYTDLRRAPQRIGESLAGARYLCISCHVALTEAQPLVDNRFQAPPPG